MITVTRLLEGTRYNIDKVSADTAEAAHAQAQKWWALPTTVAVLVEINGREDARYMRPGFDKTRVPATWPAQRTATGASMPEPTAPPPEAPAPTLFEEEPAPAPVPAAATAPAGPHLCWSCKTPLPAERKYAGDTDPTPSGRLENMRCPECGKPMLALTRRALWQLYLQGQSAKANAEQTQRVRLGRRPV